MTDLGQPREGSSGRLTSARTALTAHANLIGGEWRTAESLRPNINPSDIGDVVGDYAQGVPADVEDAIAAARAALPGWAGATAELRANVLDRTAAEIAARHEEIANLLAREEGKTLPEARGEVARAAQIFRFFAGEAVRLRGEKLPPIRTGVEVEVTRDPVGVVTLVTPWNFPIAIPAWKTAPALAFGNCVVLKPADLTPGCAWVLADILHRAGTPPGVFNLVMGSGSALSTALLSGVDAVSFTGSTGVGHAILRQAAERRIRVQLEMGGKNPLVVLDDADIDLAVATALDGGFKATGQRCTASSRFIVQENIHDDFVSRLTAALRRQHVDDARGERTTIGPVVDQRQLATDLDYIEIALSEGARLVEGGQRLERAKDGFYLSPALFTETTSAMRINREEVFGPVASVMRVKDYDEALAAANDSEFGLSAGICTRSLKHATHFKQNAQAGMVMINLPTAGVDYHAPFGGRKASSYGSREQGSYAAEFFTTTKTAYVFPG